jgi:hypothetical protein
MRDWLQHKSSFKQVLLGHHALPPRSVCILCKKQEGIIKCKDCFHHPLFCAPCAVKGHSHLPFHQVEAWNGSHFVKSDLGDLGLVLHLGHLGAACQHLGPAAEWHDVAASEEEEEEDNQDEHTGPIHHSGQADEHGQVQLVVVDKAGIFIHKFLFCHCPKAPPRWQQLLEAGYWPSSVRRPQTVFTLDLLWHYKYLSLEAKVPASSYLTALTCYFGGNKYKSLPVCADICKHISAMLTTW